MGKYQTNKGRVFEAELSKYMILARINSKEALRQRTTVGSNCTMLKYMDNPELIPIGTMNEIMAALKIPKEEKMRIIENLLEG